MTAATTPIKYKSPLREMTDTTPTCLWNDSASIPELTYALDHGAVGGTCNPVIVYGMLKKEFASWKDRICALVDKYPIATEDQIGWQIVREISAESSRVLMPAFEKHRGRNGRLSIQTDPRLYRNTQAMVDQALEFDKLAPNMIVKIPATTDGISAIEQATYQGVSINATVCFTLPQCVAVAEAIERGLRKRELESKEIATMGPVCTIIEFGFFLPLFATTCIGASSSVEMWSFLRHMPGRFASMPAISQSVRGSTIRSTQKLSMSCPRSSKTSVVRVQKTVCHFKISIRSVLPGGHCDSSSKLVTISMHLWLTHLSRIQTKPDDLLPPPQAR